ncbi:anthranilate synthase component II [Microbacterium oleivorans]|uniref:anthranilate synthase component II n=1 Tax=Microbacterium oleivorans TaxID=273677 RepID=UPI00080E0610|nr:gamma-glutamyl-gamma-aminobutyrate hydrolase family protein [Microbacterium oleivorans]
MTAGIRILVVDNHDSFVHTLIGYLVELGADVDVVEADAAGAGTGVDAADGVMISPGPGTPEEAGSSIDIVRRCADTRTPLLGVCLGHQAIAAAFGGVVSHAPDLMHGRTSLVHHDEVGVFAAMPQPFTATRYHSLAVLEESLPADLRVTARTSSGTVMGIAHRSLPIEGVQFHPESVLTEGGYLLLGTWLDGVGVTGAAQRGARLSPHRTVG